MGGKAYDIPASSLQLLIGNDLQDVFELRARGAGAMHTRVRLYRVQLSDSREPRCIADHFKNFKKDSGGN